MTSGFNLQPKPEMPRFYRVEELTTQGWEIADEKCVGLTKDEAQKALQNFLDDGLSPQRLRAVIDRG
jgi:hypothetical protein|tara:strand:+ start:1030 stop:1230 length:201 start_codon:yes stop_codon:yes gene_type:complete